MSTLDLEVVWPLHRAHYLSPALADAGIDMDTEPEASENTTASSIAAATRGRALAVRALLGSGCSQQRVADLFHTSRRSVGRIVEGDVTVALRDAGVVDQARQYLEQSVSRGVTTEERAAAAAWLEDSMKDERAMDEPVVSVSPALATHQRPVHVPPKRSSRNGADGSAKVTNAKPAAHAKAKALPPQTGLTRDQVDALARQQARIAHRSALVAYVLAAEQRLGQPLTMGDALGELLADITEAARTIATILQQVGDRRQAERLG